MIGMDDFQGIQQGRQQALEPGFIGRAAVVTQPGLECGALVVGHDHVGRAVGFPESIHLHQRGVVKRGQQTCFVDEAAHAQFEGFAVPLRAHLHGKITAARGQRGRHVFLDGHGALELRVACQVDDAKAAFTDQAVNHELVELVPDGQGVPQGCRGIRGTHARLPASLQ